MKRPREDIIENLNVCEALDLAIELNDKELIVKILNRGLSPAFGLNYLFKRVCKKFGPGSKRLQELLSLSNMVVYNLSSRETISIIRRHLKQSSITFIAIWKFRKNELDKKFYLHLDVVKLIAKYLLLANEDLIQIGKIDLFDGLIKPYKLPKSILQ
jgi:hypothetical protein